MAVPISQMWTVASYVLKQRMTGRKRYPLVLMLEPLFRCNLACAGCGKIQYPAHILKRDLSPQECFAAVEECGAPMVSLPPVRAAFHRNRGTPHDRADACGLRAEDVRARGGGRASLAQDALREEPLVPPRWR